jgi:hypothetical protein
MKPNIRVLLSIAFGVVICLVAQAALDVFWKLKHPLGSIKNSDYKLVQIADYRGEHLFDLHKGESQLLKYGKYRLTIPESNASFILWKNNRGYCDIHSGSGIPVVETDGNSGVEGTIEEAK